MHWILAILIKSNGEIEKHWDFRTNFALKRGMGRCTFGNLHQAYSNVWYTILKEIFSSPKNLYIPTSDIQIPLSKSTKSQNFTWFSYSRLVLSMNRQWNSGQEYFSCFLILLARGNCNKIISCNLFRVRSRSPVLFDFFALDY